MKLLLTIFTLGFLAVGNIFAETWFHDFDRDGFGDPLDSLVQVSQPVDYVLDNTDCDDTDPYVNPAEVELWYDGIDQNCDGNDSDADLDGYDAFEAGGDDCDDFNPGIHPGASEIWYDGIDQNCDGMNDFDYDLDGYESKVVGGDDCDDYDEFVHPGAEEICDGKDNDCDSLTNESDPLVDFSSSATQGFQPLTVSFTDLSKQCPNAINDWFWDFGDGNYSTSQDPSHDYQAGKFTVSLEITDVNDSTFTETKVDHITVYSTDPPASPASVQIQASGDNAIINWNAVDTTFTGYPTIVGTYLVYYSEIPDQDSLFFFHGFTADTTYTHNGVVKFSDKMFYQVTSYVGDVKSLNDFINEHPKFKLSELDSFIDAKKK